MHPYARLVFHHSILAVSAMALIGCDSPTMRKGDVASPLNSLSDALDSDPREKALAGRIETDTLDGATVSACILPDADARKRYGVNLASKGIQAVWLRIVNQTPHEYWLLAADLDPDYYTANEAAYRFRKSLSSGGLQKIQQRFRDLSIRARMDAGRTFEGHVLIPRAEGGRFVDVTLGRPGKVLRFGFSLRTPDGHYDYEKTDPTEIYKDQKLPDLTLAQLRSELEKLPPTATNAKGTGTADPLNLVFVGDDTSQLMTTLSECGWSFSHALDWTTIRREISAAVQRKPYLTAPLSSLYLFGRQQDLAFQRSRQNLSQRNHLRLWLAPYTVGRRPVWVGHISRDIGIKITRKSPTLTTHVIDPSVDEARQYVLESLLSRFRIERFGFVRASEPAPVGKPRFNLCGDPYITDGLRLVALLSSQPIPSEDVQNLGWEHTKVGAIEFGQKKPTD
jgi:hypothetical protein